MSGLGPTGGAARSAQPAALAPLADRPVVGGARRDMAIAAVTLVGLSRLLDGPTVWLVAVLVLAALLFGALEVLADDDPAAETTGVPVESVILPAVAAIACLGAIRLVPFGLWLAPALLATGFVVQRCLALEGRILASRGGATADDRTAVLVTTLLVGFLAFAGVAALVPGGLGDPSGRALDPSNLALLAGADATIAFLLGYRAAALRVTTLRDALWSALTYAAAIAIGAGAVRAMEIPRLIGPALLTLAFYLWDAVQGGAPARRRGLSRLGQAVLLAVLGLVVIVWNAQLAV